MMRSHTIRIAHTPKRHRMEKSTLFARLDRLFARLSRLRGGSLSCLSSAAHSLSPIRIIASHFVSISSENLIFVSLLRLICMPCSCTHASICVTYVWPVCQPVSLYPLAIYTRICQQRDIHLIHCYVCALYLNNCCSSQYNRRSIRIIKIMPENAENIVQWRLFSAFCCFPHRSFYDFMMCMCVCVLPRPPSRSSLPAAQIAYTKIMTIHPDTNER